MLILKTTSPDGEENYPGNLKVMVTYTFTDDNELMIRYEAISDKDTLCNLTNHCYFNLSGEDSGKTIENETMEINADTFTVVDAESIPTGEMRDVTGTPFDLRSGKRIGDEIDDGLRADSLRRRLRSQLQPERRRPALRRPGHRPRHRPGDERIHRHAQRAVLRRQRAQGHPPRQVRTAV